VNRAHDGCVDAIRKRVNPGTCGKSLVKLRYIGEAAAQNVLTFASRIGGAGQSTLAAHLAAHAHGPTRPCLLIDDDRQGSLTLWNELRAESALPLKIVKRGIAHIVKKAKRNGVAWIFIDTPPNNLVSVIEAIQAATLVIIPCRPGLFDIDAVQLAVNYKGDCIAS
jgi:chromosome partitioning protein